MTYLQFLTCSFYKREESQILPEKPFDSSLSALVGRGQNANLGATSSSGPPTFPSLPRLASKIAHPDFLHLPSKRRQKLLRIYTCPLTKRIIVLPVRFEGKIYEGSALLEQNEVFFREQQLMQAANEATSTLNSPRETNSTRPHLDIQPELLANLWKFRLSMTKRIYLKLKKLISPQQKMTSDLYFSNKSIATETKSLSTRRTSVVPEPFVTQQTSQHSKYSSPPQHSTLKFPPIDTNPNYKDHPKILYYIRQLLFFTGELHWNDSSVTPFINQCNEMQLCFEYYHYAKRLKCSLLGGVPGRDSLKYESRQRISREKQLRLGLVGSVRSLCQLKSNPNILVSGSQEGQIDVWDLQEEKILHSLVGHRKRIHTLAEMHDGKVLSGSFDSDIRLWDVETGKCLKEMYDHSGQVSCVLALADGKHFASCSSGCSGLDTSIRIWSYPECKQVKKLHGHKEGVSQIIQLKDGHLASCSVDKTIRIWNLHTNCCVKVLKKHAKAVLSIVELHDGTLCSSSQDGRVKIWDILTGSCIKTFQAHREPITCIVQLRDRTIATSSWDRQIRFWNPSTGRYYCSVYNDGDCAYRLLELENGTLVAGSYERIQFYR